MCLSTRATTQDAKELMVSNPFIPYETLYPTVNPRKLETGLRPNSAGIPYTLLLRIEATGFPTFWLLL